MTKPLRPFQAEMKSRSDGWFEQHRYEHPNEPGHLLEVLPTGGGKTVLMSKNIETFDRGPQIAIAHRQELVGQISMTLAANGIRHNIIAPRNIVSAIRRMQIDDLGGNYVDPRANVDVAGVDTLLARVDGLNLLKYRGAHIDEAHHVLVTNKWGTAIQSMPNAESRGYTATPVRGDGKGLGAHADGIYHVMNEGPKQRSLIDWGYLTDYRFVCETPPADLDLSQVGLGADGDYSKTKLRTAVHASKGLVGDVVQSYLRWGAGKRGITFAVDIESATELTAEYRRFGVPAEVVHGKTPDDLRRSILKRFRRGEVLQLVNVDLFGEGFDVPAVEIISMARPTKSFSLYSQQFGRVLRVMVEEMLARIWGTLSDADRLAYIAASSKPCGIVIDHVGNYKVHGMPDNTRRVFTLDRRVGAGASRVKDPDVFGLRGCLACSKPFEKYLTSCPYCGTPVPEPADRGRIESVAGDVFELDPEALAVLRGMMDQNLAPPTMGNTTPVGRSHWARHQEKLTEYHNLRYWAGLWMAGVSARSMRPMTDGEQARAFYGTFGIDTITMQSLPRADMEALRVKVQEMCAIDNIVSN